MGWGESDLIPPGLAVGDSRMDTRPAVGDDAGNATTMESDMNTIEAVRSSLGADLEHQRPEIPNLNLEDLCMVVAQ